MPTTPLLEDYQRYTSTGTVWPPPPYNRYISRTDAPAMRRNIPIPTGPTSLRDSEYNYLMKRLEEKIMDRMKIQMDVLYQKIEDRMMEQ